VRRRRVGGDRLLRVGIVAHAEPDFGNGRLQLSDPQEAYRLAAPDPKAFATHSIALYCPNADDVVTRAERGGRDHPGTRPDLRHRRPVRVDS
jgi:hypothetical protein